MQHRSVKEITLYQLIEANSLSSALKTALLTWALRTKVDWGKVSNDNKPLKYLPNQVSGLRYDIKSGKARLKKNYLIYKQVIFKIYDDMNFLKVGFVPKDDFATEFIVLLSLFKT